MASVAMPTYKVKRREIMRSLFEAQPTDPVTAFTSDGNASEDACVPVILKRAQFRAQLDWSATVSVAGFKRR